MERERRRAQRYHCPEPSQGKSALGLLAFDESDAAIYFGRDDDIRRIIERLNARRAQGGAKLVVLLGASGSGKSSLMKAGVLPRLKRDQRNWVVTPQFGPQTHPLDELALAIAQALGPNSNWRTVRERLSVNDLERSLSDLVRDLRAAQAANDAWVLLSIDQGEELFGTSDPIEATEFWKLLDAILNEHLPFIVLLGLRSDYLRQLQQAPALTVPFDEFSLKPLPLDRVRDIIEGPARVVGLTVDNALVTAVIKDAATDDGLPLLAFVLRELYDRFSQTRLTIEAYCTLGDEKAGLSPLENAVRRKADEVLSEASPTREVLQALKEAFIPAMVRENTEGEYVRCPAPVDSLPDLARPLIERLVKARLLIKREEVVEVAHEALLRKWQLLRTWLDEEHDFLIGKQQLEQDLRDWQTGPGDKKVEALLSGLKLSRAREWIVRCPAHLSRAEREFIYASIARQDAVAAYKKARAFALESYVRSLLELRIRELKEENDRLEKSGSMRSVSYFDAREKENEVEIDTIRNFLQTDGRWHPQEPVYKQSTGPRGDYADVYYFPCCDKYVLTDNRVPTQFRADGCCASPEVETAPESSKPEDV